MSARLFSLISASAADLLPRAMVWFHRQKKTAAQIRVEIASLQNELERMGEPAVDEDQKDSKQSESSDHSSSNALFATLSHELRTPLNGVLGMAQLLKEEIDSPKLETLESCAQHMQSVLHHTTREKFRKISQRKAIV